MMRGRPVRSWFTGGLVLATAGVATAIPTTAIPATASATASATVPAASTRYEAESATISQGTVASDHSGFTGPGFVDFTNVAGSYVEFSVPEAGATSATLTFRFANGTATDRPMSLSVGGVAAAPLSFPGTGAWTTWKTVAVPVSLAAGTNTIRVTATTANGGPNLDSLTVDAVLDWSTRLVDSTMARFTPSTLGGWGYTEGLYLYGQYLVYQRTHDPAYLSYIKSWADRFVGSDGSIDNSFDNLDSMQSGNILLILYKETGQARYRTAATKIWTRLEGTNGTNGSYPRTSDGGFWHGTTRQHQLWLDGTYMALPFLVNYGAIVGNATIADAEAVRQLLVYGGHLEAPDGLLYHAYDESAAQSWVVPGTNRSPEFWCRAIGWYGMAAVTVLDSVPAGQPDRDRVLTILRNLVAAMKAYQDPATGRWFQVVDKGSRSDDWTETSCSAMYTYTISRSVEQGYVDASYAAVAGKGYQGVLAKISLGSDGRTNLTDISIGTNVGDYAYYAGRTRATNDQHGLGSFLIMNEQLMRTGG